MNIIHDFNKSISVGEFGEIIIKKFLAKNSNIIDIEDVSKNEEYQKKDIDLIVYFKNGNSYTIEIKTDTYTSGNIFFETISNLEHNVPGCMYKTQADFLFYYFTKTKELYIINMKAYLSWFEQHILKFKKKELKNYAKTNGTYTSVGYTIPKIFLEEDFLKYKKIILD